MQTDTSMAIATMIPATSTDNLALEVTNVNISSVSITAEPAQDVKNLSLTSQASDATVLGSYPFYDGLPPEVPARSAGRGTTHW